MRKRLLSILLVCCMTFSLLPGMTLKAAAASSIPTYATIDEIPEDLTIFKALISGTIKAEQIDKVWYYRFANGNTIIRVKATAFTQEPSNNYLNADNAAINASLSKDSTDEAHRYCYYTDYKKQDKYELATNFTQHSYNLYRLYLKVDSSGSVFSASSTITHCVKFIYNTKVKIDPTDWAAGQTASLYNSMTTPSTARQYESALTRVRYCDGFTPKYEVSITNTGKNANYFKWYDFECNGNAEYTNAIVAINEIYQSAKLVANTITGLITPSPAGIAGLALQWANYTLPSFDKKSNRYNNGKHIELDHHGYNIGDRIVSPVMLSQMDDYAQFDVALKDSIKDTKLHINFGFDDASVSTYSVKPLTFNAPNYADPSSLDISPQSNAITINEGSNCPLRGSISSNYQLTKVRGLLDGKEYACITSGLLSSMNISGSQIDNKMVGSKLSAGTHTVRFEATDSSGKTVTKDITITVKPKATTVLPPTITYVDTEGGKVVTITQNTAGATLYYYYYACALEGTGNKSTTQNSVSFTINRDATIAAYSEKSGSIAKCADLYIPVSRLAAPVIVYEKTGIGANITVKAQDRSAELWVSTDGENFQRNYGYLSVDDRCTIYAYAKRAGYLNSEVVSQEIELTAPEATSIVYPATGIKLARDELVTLRWNPISNASSYQINVYRNGNLISLTENGGANTETIELAELGEYTFSVIAKNKFGSSNESNSVTVTSMPPVMVTFEDWDGTILSSQEVAYNKSAVAPSDPERIGHYFRYWDGNYENVTEDKIIHPVYEIIKYKVTFVDQNGDRIGDAQTIKYGNHALEPGPNDFSIPTGYVLMGWSISAESVDSACDLTFVDSNMTAKAVIGWKDAELPVVAEIISAQRNDADADGNYSISVRLTNTPDHFTTALLRVSLKTAEGKMVKTESRTVGLKADTSDVFDFTINYSGTATKVEAVALGYNGDYLTGSANSEAVSAAVEVISGYVYNAWSNWSTAKPDSSVVGREIESKTQYRYKGQQYTTSSSSYMDGWTNYGVQSYWSDYGPWSDWTTTAISSSDYVNVQPATQYRYYRCKCNRCNNDWYGGRSCSCGGYMNVYEYLWSFTDPWTLDAAGRFDWGFLSSGAVARTWGLDGTNAYWYYYPNTKNASWQYQTRTVYRSQSRSLLYTYYFWKWGPFSDWQDDYVAKTDQNIVETRTVYRYRDQNAVFSDLTGNEDISGEYYTFTNATSTMPMNDPYTYHVPNTLPGTDTIDLNGKLATIMVYKGKNSDPNESQLQYVGQTTIGSGNTFDFSFKTKDAPSETTGDYVVCLSVQGSTGLINIGVIEAPKVQYTVNFYNADGSLIDSQAVKEGKNAVIPDAPIREGYTFVTWSESGTNITRDTNITAIYVPKTYAVTFVDWVNGTAVPFALEYGYDLGALAKTMTPSAEGHTFNGWVDDAGNPIAADATVTQNMVLSAKYTAESYRVRFFDDVGGSVTCTRTVAFGQAAQLPEPPQVAGKVFLGWSTETEWWNVKSDMDVYPIMICEETTMIPKTDASSYQEGMELLLNLEAEDGAVIYYTTDDSEPTEESTVYTGQLYFTNDTVLKAIAVTPGKNPSDVLEVYFSYCGDELSVAEDLVEIGSYTVSVNPGEDISIRTILDSNPGLLGYLFTIECDRSVFYLDSDDVTGYACNKGTACENGTMFCADYRSDGWQVFWFNSEASFGAGNIFDLTLHVDDDAIPGTYEIVVSYSPQNTVTENDLEVHGLNAQTAIYSNDSLIIGDVNGDGDVTVFDVVLIARNILGMESFTEAEKLSADVNYDGEITNADAIKLLRYIVGLTRLD